MLPFLLSGVLLGLSAGFTPGPLLALVLSGTLRHGKGAGIRVAIAPVITDLPIVVLSLLVLSKLSVFHGVLGAISVMGGFFVLFMGYQSVSAKPPALGDAEGRPRPVVKGVLTNVLSPHPYLFWLTVGAPTITRALDSGIAAPAAFVVGFYALLVGSKILLAVLTGKSRRFLGGTAYLYITRFLGVALCVLALHLFRDGFALLDAL